MSEMLLVDSIKNYLSLDYKPCYYYYYVLFIDYKPWSSRTPSELLWGHKVPIYLSYLPFDFFSSFYNNLYLFPRF